MIDNAAFSSFDLVVIERNYATFTKIDKFDGSVIIHRGAEPTSQGPLFSAHSLNLIDE